MHLTYELKLVQLTFIQLLFSTAIMNYRPYQQFQQPQPNRRFYSQERSINPLIQPRPSSQMLNQILGYSIHSSSAVQFFKRPIQFQSNYIQPKLVKVFDKEQVHHIKPAFCKKINKNETEETSFKEQVEQLKILFPKNTKHSNISLSSSSCLTLEVADQEQFQCEKALEIMQMLDQQISKKQSAQFGGRQQEQQTNTIKKYKFSFSGVHDQSATEQEVKCQNKNRSNHQIPEMLSKAYYSSKDLSQLGSSYYGESEKSFQRNNRISSTNQQNKMSKFKEEIKSTKTLQINDNSKQEINQDHQRQSDIISDKKLKSKPDMIKECEVQQSNSNLNLQQDENQCSVEQTNVNVETGKKIISKQNTSLKNSPSRNRIRSGQDLKQQQNENFIYESPNKKEEILQIPKQRIQKLLEESQTVNIQESQIANQKYTYINPVEIHSEKIELITSEKLELKQSEKDFYKKEQNPIIDQQASMLQIIQFIQQQQQQQQQFKNHTATNSQVQQFFSTNHSNQSSAPQFKVDLMKGSYLLDQSRSSSQKKKIVILEMEPQQEYYNKQSKQLGYFNYQISIINPGPLENDIKKSHSAQKHRESFDLSNKDIYFNQQEMRLKRLEEHILLTQPKNCDLLGIQQNVDLLDLSKPFNEYHLQPSEDEILQEGFYHSLPNQNKYVKLPQQSSTSNIYQSKSQLLAPPIEDSISYLQPQYYVDKTSQMEEGFDLIAKKKQQEEAIVKKTKIRQKKSFSGNQEKLIQKNKKQENKNSQRVNNYTEHLQMVQAFYDQKQNLQQLKDISSPSLSSIQQEQSSKSFFQQKQTNFISSNKKSISKKNKKGKLDPYFEFKRQLNKNLEDFTQNQESYSTFNSVSRSQLHHARKATAMTQFGELSDENRGNFQSQIYRRTIEQVQLKLQQLQRS